MSPHRPGRFSLYPMPCSCPFGIPTNVFIATWTLHSSRVAGGGDACTPTVVLADRIGCSREKNCPPTWCPQPVGSAQGGALLVREGTDGVAAVLEIYGSLVSPRF